MNGRGGNQPDLQASGPAGPWRIQPWCRRADAVGAAAVAVLTLSGQVHVPHKNQARQRFTADYRAHDADFQQVEGALVRFFGHKTQRELRHHRAIRSLGDMAKALIVIEREI
jgi:hypothetical protein